jgi:probable HAF family extracellular repeat protein
MTLNRLSRCACAAICILLGLASEVRAYDFNFIPIDVPGATTTLASGINDRGHIVGSFFDANGMPHGFLNNHGTFTTIDFPGATRTSLSGINNHGDIVGDYFIPRQGLVEPQNNAFLYNRGAFTVIDSPRGEDRGPIVNGINNRGQMVGDIDAGRFVPFLRNPNGQITVIDVPGSTVLTHGFDINNGGDIVGSFHPASGPAESGFLDEHGRFTTIDVPGASTTQALGLNDRGVIVGSYLGLDNRSHGFLDIRGHFITVDVPGARSTTVTGINNHGLFVGSFIDANGHTRGYVDPPSEVPEPASWFLLASGISGFVLFKKRFNDSANMLDGLDR